MTAEEVLEPLNSLLDFGAFKWLTIRGDLNSKSKNEHSISMKSKHHWQFFQWFFFSLTTISYKSGALVLQVRKLELLLHPSAI